MEIKTELFKIFSTEVEEFTRLEGKTDYKYLYCDYEHFWKIFEQHLNDNFSETEKFIKESYYEIYKVKVVPYTQHPTQIYFVW